MLVVINAQYPCLRKVSNNGREGSSGGSADIQHILDPFPPLISEPDLLVGRSGSKEEILGEELSVDVGINGGRDVAEDTGQHAEETKCEFFEAIHSC